MATTRGPLPAGVYWRRRLVLLLLLTSLVVVGLRAFGGDDTGGGAQSASDAAADVSSEEDGADEAARAERRAARQARREARREARRAAREEALAPPPEPEGRCVDEDVVVTPLVPDALAGQDVIVVLNLRTLSSPACTWKVSPAHLSLKVTSGSDGIWSSQECPGQLDRGEVIVRQETTSTLSLTWNARRSEPGCPGDTSWAAPGYYHAVASSLGGEPNDVQFRLVDPATLTAAQQRVVEEQAAEARREARREARQRAQATDREDGGGRRSG